MSEPYNEDTVLTDYIWRNYYHLMTGFERTAVKVSLAERGLTISRPNLVNILENTAAILRRSWEAQIDPMAVEALSSGEAAFRTYVRDRLLRDHQAGIIINRCQACGRIVRTPQAQQCLWCGHDWHGVRVMEK